jgi:hypothetical protein
VVIERVVTKRDDAKNAPKQITPDDVEYQPDFFFLWVLTGFNGFECI